MGTAGRVQQMCSDLIYMADTMICCRFSMQKSTLCAFTHTVPFVVHSEKHVLFPCNIWNYCGIFNREKFSANKKGTGIHCNLFCTRNPSFAFVLAKF